MNERKVRCNYTLTASRDDFSKGTPWTADGREEGRP